MDLSFFSSPYLQIEERWIQGNIDRINHTIMNAGPAAIEEARNHVEALMSNQERLYVGSNFVRFAGDTAIVPIEGVLSKKMDFWMYWFGGTSSQRLGDVFQILGSMDSVKNVLLDIDSPGGSVGGLFEAAAAARDLREKKKLVAFSNDLNASGAWMISSAAEEMYVNPSSRTGSFGTVAIITNYSRMLEDKGIKVEVVRAGDMKARPNPYEALEDKDIAEVKSAVDKHYEDFIGSVVLNLGISDEKARSMADGRVYEGERAIEAGFATQTGSMNTILATLQNSSTLVDANTIEEKWPGILAIDSKSITKKQPENIPMSTQNTPGNVDTSQIEMLNEALERANALIQQQSALLEQNTYRQVDENNSRVIGALVESMRVKPRFRGGLVALMGQLSRSNEKLVFQQDGATVEQSSVEFLLEFMNSLMPMVQKEAVISDTSATPSASGDNTTDLMTRAQALIAQYAAKGQTLEVNKAVAMVAKAQA